LTGLDRGWPGELVRKELEVTHIFGFGETVPGYDVPVLNEREIRASAGLLFVAMLISLMLILFQGDFLLIKYVLTVFLTDLAIRLFVSPRFAPTLIVGRLIVRNQVPEYVAAAPKRFAWIIGLGLAGLMFTFLVVVNAYSPITGLACLVCLIFLFFETAFGICLGCLVHSWIYRQKARHCPGETCDESRRSHRQRTSRGQIAVVLGFTVGMVLMVATFNDYFARRPHNLFNRSGSAQVK